MRASVTLLSLVVLAACDGSSTTGDTGADPIDDADVEVVEDGVDVPDVEEDLPTDVPPDEAEDPPSPKGGPPLVRIILCILPSKVADPLF